MSTRRSRFFSEWRFFSDRRFSFAALVGAALVLISIVMILNLVARVIGSYFSPKTGR